MTEHNMAPIPVSGHLAIGPFLLSSSCNPSVWPQAQTIMALLLYLMSCFGLIDRDPILT